jgi:Tfp pilus assembly protein PilV
MAPRADAMPYVIKVHGISALGTAASPVILSVTGGFMRKLVFVFTVAALFAGAAANAQTPTTGSGLRYKWQDGQGKVHFSDSLTAEAMKYGFDAVNDQGLVIQHVPRQLTPEERTAANQLAADQAKKQRIEQDRINADSQMLEAYPDENTYKISQQQALDTLDQQIHTTQLNLKTQEKALTDLLGRAAEIERTQKTVPKFISDSIASQRAVVTAQQSTLQHQQALRAQTVQDQASQLAHYREIKAAQAKPTP